MKRFAAALAAVFSAGAAAAQPAIPPPLRVPVASGPITIDGRLSEDAWKSAAVIDEFWETNPGDNTPPKVKTVAYLAYDDRFLYIGLRCDDPEPDKIRAPYVERDQVLGTDDNVAVFIDTRNDRRSAMEFRVNPRGIQGDAMFNDANGNENLSPDFFYDTAAEIGPQGWTAEMRIPLSTLRYKKTDSQKMGIIIWRNYPRDYRYAIYSSPQPRGSNCLICFSRELTGFENLPSGQHFVIAPYVSAKEDGAPRDPANPDSAFLNQPVEPNGGGDIKWIPNPDTAVDAAINPDFSQVESDTAQIAVNQRFALLFPEKRPFFLEGVDLFDTPISAVYTRTITDPSWGLRGTGKIDSSSYTVLVAEDRGGGTVVLPGPEFSNSAPQDFHSFVAIGRLRHDFGTSFGGLLLTDREISGGGHNRLLGPDFQWAIGTDDRITAQYLYSDSEEPDRPDLSPSWNGEHLSGHGLSLDWTHTNLTTFFEATYKDFSNGFRADDGFVPQVGYRGGTLNAGRPFYPASGLFSYLRPRVGEDYQEDRDGLMIFRRVFPGLDFIGKKNLTGFVGANLDTVRVAGKLLSADYGVFQVQVDPSRRFTRILLTGSFGQQIDFDNGREGHGADVALTLTLHPTDHLELIALGERSWLDVAPTPGADAQRLFTAWIGRLKATYVFDARLSLRLIGQWVETQRDPSLYTFSVPARAGEFDGSVLFSYKVNWQTVAYLGYGDSHVLFPEGDILPVPPTSYRLAPLSRQFFLKISYAFQR
jgi:hypothetical protein